MEKIKNIPIGVVILNDFKTWPQNLVAQLNILRPTIGNYIQFERALDKKAETNVLFRLNRPYNPHQNIWQRAIEITENLLKGSMILGFHATRLLPEEISEILKNGLEPLSENLIKRRLLLIHEMGLISEEIRQELLLHSQAKTPGRAGNVFMFHSMETCKDSSGLGRLLGRYGGESLYWYYDKDESKKSILRSIGRPAIVLGVIPFEKLNSQYSVSSRMLKYFWRRREFSDFDSFTNASVQVLGVLDSSNAEFEKLTKYSQWKNKN